MPKPQRRKNQRKPNKRKEKKFKEPRTKADAFEPPSSSLKEPITEPQALNEYECATQHEKIKCDDSCKELQDCAESEPPSSSSHASEDETQTQTQTQSTLVRTQQDSPTEQKTSSIPTQLTGTQDSHIPSPVKQKTLPVPAVNDTSTEIVLFITYIDPNSTRNVIRNAITNKLKEAVPNLNLNNIKFSFYTNPGTNVICALDLTIRLDDSLETQMAQLSFGSSLFDQIKKSLFLLQIGNRKILIFPSKLSTHPYKPISESDSDIDDNLLVFNYMLFLCNEFLYCFKDVFFIIGDGQKEIDNKKIIFFSDKEKYLTLAREAELEEISHEIYKKFCNFLEYEKVDNQIKYYLNRALNGKEIDSKARKYVYDYLNSNKTNYKHKSVNEETKKEIIERLIKAFGLPFTCHRDCFENFGQVLKAFHESLKIKSGTIPDLCKRSKCIIDVFNRIFQTFSISIYEIPEFLISQISPDKMKEIINDSNNRYNYIIIEFIKIFTSELYKKSLIMLGGPTPNSQVFEGLIRHEEPSLGKIKEFFSVQFASVKNPEDKKLRINRCKLVHKCEPTMPVRFRISCD